MGLLDNEIADIQKEYFNVWEVIELLHKKTKEDWVEISKFLSHYKIYSQLSLYEVNYCSLLYPYSDITPIINLLFELSLIDDWIQESEKNTKILRAKFNVKTLFWKKQDVYNFEPLKSLGIFEGVTLLDNKENQIVRKSMLELLIDHNKKLQEDILEKERKIIAIQVSPSTQDESKLGSYRAENNVTKLLLVLATMAKIEPDKPYAMHGSLLAQADLLGVDRFPSADTVKKWLNKAKIHANNQNPN